MSAHILDTVPDLIRSQAVAAGVSNDEISTPIGTLGSVPQELKDAYRSGDYKTIQKYKDKTAADLNPIYDNIKENGRNAFTSIRNDSDGATYWITISGPRDKPDAYMWIYAPEKEATVSASGGNDSSTTRVAQFGTLSVNSNTLGISNQVWGNTNVHFGAGTLAVVVMTVVTKFIKRRLTSALAGEAVETAAGAAATEAGTELAVEGVVEAATWITITASIAGLVVGIAAGIAAYYLIMFIANFVWKSYRISISIHNWSSNDYIVDSYYADNAKIEGEKEFKETRLPAAGRSIKMPDSFRPTGMMYQYAQFTYANDSQILQGLGVAMRVKKKDSSTGFQLKYLCSRFKDNRIGIADGIHDTLYDYYHNEGNWAPKESYNAQSTIDGSNEPITCTTTALGGRDDHLYHFDVHIGLKPNSDHGKAREPMLAQPLLPDPETASTPQVGEEIRMPNGDVSQVVSYI